MSNLCNFSKLVLSTHPLLFYQLLSPYQTFVIFSSFLIYSLSTLSTQPINVPALHTKQHNSLSCLIGRTSSVPIQLSKSTIVFGHCAILIWGDRGMTGGFILHQTQLLYAPLSGQAIATRMLLVLILKGNLIVLKRSYNFSEQT